MGSYTQDWTPKCISASRKLHVKTTNPVNRLFTDGETEEGMRGDGRKASRGEVGCPADLGVLAPGPLSSGLGMGILPSLQGMGRMGTLGGAGSAFPNGMYPNPDWDFFPHPSFLEHLCQLPPGMACARWDRSTTGTQQTCELICLIQKRLQRGAGLGRIKCSLNSNYW